MDEINKPQIPKPPLPSNKPSGPKLPVGNDKQVNLPFKKTTQPQISTPSRSISSSSSTTPPQFSSSIEQRLWEAEQAKRQMEIQLQELQRMLLEERKNL